MKLAQRLTNIEHSLEAGDQESAKRLLTWLSKEALESLQRSLWSTLFGYTDLLKEFRKRLDTLLLVMNSFPIIFRVEYLFSSLLIETLLSMKDKQSAFWFQLTWNSKKVGPSILPTLRLNEYSNQLLTDIFFLVMDFPTAALYIEPKVNVCLKAQTLSIPSIKLIRDDFHQAFPWFTLQRPDLQSDLPIRQRKFIIIIPDIESMSYDEISKNYPAVLKYLLALLEARLS